METTGERLFNIIRKMGEETLSYSEIIKAAKEEGINRDALDTYLSVLRKMGLIYSPKPGIYKLAE